MFSTAVYWYMFNNQLPGVGVKGTLVCSICPFPWCKYSYPSWFQATSSTSRNAKPRRGHTISQPSAARTSWLRHSTGFGDLRWSYVQPTWQDIWTVCWNNALKKKRKTTEKRENEANGTKRQQWLHLGDGYMGVYSTTTFFYCVYLNIVKIKHLKWKHHLIYI